MKIDIEHIENMTIEQMKEFIKKDISQEEFKNIKETMIKEINMKNDILDLINKYGIENTPKLVNILVEEMELYFKLLTEFQDKEPLVNEKCCCCCEDKI